MSSNELWTPEQLNLLQSLPPGPTVSLKRSKELHPEGASALPERVAAHLLPLSGVQNPTRGDGRTHCLAYPHLSLTALRRGAPSGVPVRSLLAGEAGVIATGTTAHFNPDSLAALILTGANYAFAPITQAYGDALRGLTLQGVSPRMRLGAVAGLGFQAFREQPGLFTTAVQAARIQDTKVNRNLWPVENTPRRNPKYYSPTTFNLMRLFEGGEAAWGFDPGRMSLSDIFAENCRSDTKKQGEVIVPHDAKHVVPKVIAHPGNFARFFLEDITQFPPEDEWLDRPLSPKDADYATLMASWIVNDLSCIFLEEGRETRSFHLANRQLEWQMREALSP